MNKEFEALDKLEECANGMRDLPKSNWIDLAENEAELDLKIMDWVETIKFELFKGKQAITELKAIKEAKPSEAMECVERLNQTINLAENFYDSVYEDKDMFVAVQRDVDAIKQALLKAQELEKELADVEKVKSGKIIIYFGKDLVMMNKNKYYEYVENENEPVSKRILQAKCEEQEKVLEIVKDKWVNVAVLIHSKTVEKYNNDAHTPYNLTQEEFDLVKRWSEK